MGNPEVWILCQECKEPVSSRYAIEGTIIIAEDMTEHRAWFCSDCAKTPETDKANGDAA